MRVAATIIALALAATAPTWAAGGTPAPEIGPEERAAEAYNRGLRYRAEGLEREAEAGSLSGADRDKKLAKATKEFEKAVRAYRNAVELDPQMHEAHSGLGFALRKLGDYEESLAAYDRALELAPGYPEAIEYRAEAYLGLGRLDDVETAYMELFRTDRPRADQLLAAIQSWLEGRAGDPGDIDAARFEAFSSWASERAAAAAQTAELSGVAVAAW